MKLNKFGDFETGKTSDYVLNMTDVFALPDDYEPKKETKCEWEEFDIDKQGSFWWNGWAFKWYDWVGFLKFSYERAYAFADTDTVFTAPGGWQYEEDGAWITTPMLQTRDDCGIPHYVNRLSTNDVGPAIPIKIRFWRENKR